MLGTAFQILPKKRIVIIMAPNWGVALGLSSVVKHFDITKAIFPCFYSAVVDFAPTYSHLNNWKMSSPPQHHHGSPLNLLFALQRIGITLVPWQQAPIIYGVAILKLRINYENRRRLESWTRSDFFYLRSSHIRRSRITPTGSDVVRYSGNFIVR